MTKDPATPKKVASTALEKSEKGSSRSMWELLLQLRVLLPYLARLVPLIEPLVERATARQPQLPDISQTINALETGSRDLEVQARNQALHLERLAQHMERLVEAQQTAAEENRKLTAELHTLRRSVLIFGGSILVLLLALGGMTGYLLFHV
jgi:chromosome segregation ATPase